LKDLGKIPVVKDRFAKFVIMGAQRVT